MVRLVDVVRSNLIESTHYGSIAVVDSHGRIIHQLGDADRMTFFHSSAKPIQAAVALEAGIAEEFKLDLKELALMMSSHSGEKEHIRVLQEIMEKLGVGEEVMECGIADPVSKEVLAELHSEGKKPGKLHCNCSGKHLAFIAVSKLKGYPLEAYHEAGHPIQESVKKVLADFCGVQPEAMMKGIDGCTVPAYAMPLRNLARAYANLCDPGFMGGKYNKSQNYILSAMTLYPEMVAGKGRIDTALMKRYGSKVIGKIGAEGVYCSGLVGKGIGIAVKIEDGNTRAAGPAIIEALVQLQALSKEEAGELKEHWKPPLLNNKGENIGEIKPVFRLH